ncbi:carotenoid cleavage dioxygenase [Cucumis melo var. makuwa]|uniref:Carotenoid cleavage dioxygenase n=1 Tax=Cucumis melo var. makuwa TaxID=1194695 RepID=A0A5A7V3G4_CUCMM|nr:carotenoid cleavage dioxygenase [Cucumis melo var. makuwa]TYK22145.1 carotenoid cleavage dioxygenase [Cucumis melo var. makuwa]
MTPSSKNSNNAGTGTANAWEEGDELVLITCRLENPDLDMVSGSVKEKLENFSNEL